MKLISEKPWKSIKEYERHLKMGTYYYVRGKDREGHIYSFATYHGQYWMDHFTEKKVDFEVTEYREV
jgi:hypothetical protein